MSRYIVGLTGGIGSGKSAVADCFRRLGIKVVDADIAARAVVAPGTAALAQIGVHFGASVIQTDGELDRAALRQIVFNDDAQRHWLEQLLHPEIARWIATELAAAQSPYAILESPLLLETTQHNLTQRVLVVDVPEALQVARAAARDHNDPEQIKAIMATQLSRAERRARADDLIDNAGALDALEQAVAELHDHYCRLAEKAAPRDE